MQVPLLSLILFSLAMAITPGPNNIMVTASGSQFGFRRTIPHIAGIAAGMLLVLTACAFGLEKVFLHWPRLRTAMQIASILYIAYLAYRIAGIDADSLNPATKKTRPLRAYESAVFQIINPKAFAIATTLISTFSLPGGDYPGSIAVIGSVMLGVCIPAVSFWALFGTYMKSWLKTPWLLRTFNVTMAILSLGSVLYGLL
jgi:threonine/homoserine/homoserine lactone efflux protein